ncbi:MAG: alpha/beta family hydrolase [Micromonosporaceae bacterium]
MSEVSTPRGPARVRWHHPPGPVRSLLMLGHGAGGDVSAPDLTAVCSAALRAGVAVALITQPYRVAGRRSPPAAPVLDEAWMSVVAAARAGQAHLPLILGGRSSGARVACRTAVALGAVGVVALAFPLHPPGDQAKSRAGELETGVPTLVVNGDRDVFGVPEPGPSRQVLIRPGEGHSLRRDPNAVAAAVVAWLREHGWAGAESA